MIKSLCFIALFFTTIVFSQPSFALSKLGHQIVCQLAFDHLSLAKQQRVTQLLHAVPRDQQTLINNYNGSNSQSPITFAKACTWADAIKNSAQYEQYKSWHYMNVPRNLSRITKPRCSKNCVPQAIITHQEQLKSSPRSWESAQALLFIGHWLGDIHQPLHVSYASDLGGNKVKIVKSKSSCKNLHQYWDYCLLKKVKRSQKGWVKRIERQWNTVSVPAYYSQQVWGWADESYQLIREPSFKYCHLTTQGYCEPIPGNIALSDDYARKNLPIMEKQLLKAAKRLTRLLEVTL